MIGDVLLECELDGERQTVAGFENHGGQTALDPGRLVRPRPFGFGNHGSPPPRVAAPANAVATTSRTVAAT